jgi:hypothetical protein
MSKASIADKRWYWPIALLTLTLLALGLRWTYVTRIEVDHPIRGDALQYVAYAWNLVHHGAFSKSPPGSTEVVPDSFRDPGYPSLLAGVMLIFDSLVPWYRTVLLLQGLLGALTVTLLTAAVRPWLGPRWSVAAGLLMAFWPHSISITGFLLSETATAFWVALALFLLQRTTKRGGRLPMTACGIAFGVAAMTNAVLIPFAALLAVVLWWRGNSTRSTVLILAFSSLLLPLGWGLRNAQLPAADNSSGRALLNAVQGSWPEYHASYLASVMGDRSAIQIQANIGHEYDVLRTSTAAGLQLVSSRMRQRPLRYLAWYASKPALLWDWSIRIGKGNIYVYATSHSILDEQPILRAIVAMCWALNPLIMLLALAGAVIVWVKRREPSPVPLAVALLAGYVTLVYSLLQAEPRYSIPFRGIELILAIETMRRVALWRTARIQRAWHAASQGAESPSSTSLSEPDTSL